MLYVILRQLFIPTLGFATNSSLASLHAPSQNHLFWGQARSGSASQTSPVV